MECLVTTCSRDKRPDHGPLPALERYLSNRINFVAAESARLGLPLLIFSAKYGLLRPREPIHYYNLKLDWDQVSAMARKLASQLRAYGVTALHFYGWPQGTDGWGSYHKALRQACTFENVRFNFVACNIPD